MASEEKAKKKFNVVVKHINEQIVRKYKGFKSTF